MVPTKYGYMSDLEKSGIRFMITKWENSNWFEVNFLVQYSDNLNIAFRDFASNWDNNSGDNYSFGIAH